jgi:hypothetical protein
MLQKEVRAPIEEKKITLENPKSIIPRAKKIPVNFRENRYGADIEYEERKLPVEYKDDMEL